MRRLVRRLNKLISRSFEKRLTLHPIQTGCVFTAHSGWTDDFEKAFGCWKNGNNLTEDLHET